MDGINTMAMPSWEMSESEKTLLNFEVDRMNKEVLGSRKPQQELGKNEFLQLLIAQLTHQDPTSPMEDTEFISQMAQFTSLEQMMNMNETLTKVGELMGKSEAITAVGKKVDLELPEGMISGYVSAVRRGEVPEVQVNGNWYAWSTVNTIYAQ